MRIISVSIVRAALALALGLGGAAAGSAGCAGASTSSQGSNLPQRLLSGESRAPSLFMGSEPGAPVVGFLGKDVRVDVAGPTVAGRVPVRVRGALLVRGYVPEAMLGLRAQRHGKVRGTPVYLGPNDPVAVLGDDAEPGRLKVRVTPKVAELRVASFEGSYPAVGIAAEPNANAEPMPKGDTHELAAGSALWLYDQPGGQAVAELPARSVALSLEVLSKQGIWSAVRVGSGPYLVGYTDAYLAPRPAAGSPADRAEREATHAARGQAAGAGDVPARLISESGELKRVAAGAAVSFGDQVFAKLQKPGFARVLATYPNGEADALVAVDDEVAVRGMVRGTDLSPPLPAELRGAQ